MRARGRRIAIGTAAAGLFTLVVAGYLLRDEIAWRWRTRGVVEVRVDHEPWLVDLELKDPAAVASALRTTRRFLASLPRATHEEVQELTFGLVAASSAVIFCAGDDAGRGNLKLHYYASHGGDGLLATDLGNFLCPEPALIRYLGDLIRPRTPEFLRTWRGPGWSRAERTTAAACLALTAPETEGLLEFLLEAMEDRDRAGLAVFAMGAMGSRGSPAVPALARIVGDPGYLESSRAGAARALGAIGPAATEAVPFLEEVVATAGAGSAMAKAAREAIARIAHP